MSGFDLSKPVPANPEAEQSVLAAILARPERIEEAAGELSPASFHARDHRAIYGAMLALRDQNRTIDLVTLSDALLQAGKLHEAGGQVRLGEVAAGFAGNFMESLRIVREMAARRAFIETGLALVEGGHDLTRDLPSLAQLAHRAGATGWNGGPRLVVADAAQLLSLELPPREYILNPVIPRQGLVMLYAPRGIGKTYMALSIAYAAASGQWVFRWQAPEPRRVLYRTAKCQPTPCRKGWPPSWLGTSGSFPAPNGCASSPRTCKA